MTAFVVLGLLVIFGCNQKVGSWGYGLRYAKICKIPKGFLTAQSLQIVAATVRELELRELLPHEPQQLPFLTATNSLALAIADAVAIAIAVCELYCKR
jgi:hypothetical protein